MPHFKTRYDRRDEEKERFNIAEWAPRTELGREVKAGSVTTIEQIYHEGRNIEEAEIIDALLPNLKSEVVEISSVQRMTKNNRKQKYRVTAVVGDMNGHIGVGAGKDVEVRAAIDSAIKDAKSRVIPIILGCGSWQCLCKLKHSIPFTVKGKCGAVQVILKPAPRGLGVVANKPVKLALELAGLKDVWTFSRGRTRSKYNMLLAVFRALEEINHMKNIEDKVLMQD